MDNYINVSEETRKWINKDERNQKMNNVLVDAVSKYSSNFLKTNDRNEINICFLKYYILNSVSKKSKMQFTFEGPTGKAITDIVIATAKSCGLTVTAD